ncbi:AAA family ATPase, partial [Streptomyces sp. NPDC006283]|uniref:AAA family ATPase n=1 Tax=Streptomyces sp. NPDC006283 TaxID=3156741 RepID=UPI0033B546DE
MQEPKPQWPLAGRDRELEAFTAAWGERHCEVVVISGSAGAGKSRLGEECLARAVRAGYKGVRAVASASSATMPLGAIAHLIPAGVDLSDPVKGYAAVAHALSGPQQGRWAFWVDDLHLLDAASGVLLRQLMDAGMVRLICTVRTGEPVTEAVDALTSGLAVHRMELTEFTAEQAGEVLQVALGGPIGRHALQELHSTSGGNALYLRELVQGALQAGSLASDGEIWRLAKDWLVVTPNLIELIEARLAAANLQARPVLELLALCELVPLADAQTLASLDTLADLEEAGLTQVTTDRRRTSVQFAHPLYREVLRAGIHAPRRRTLLLQQAERAKARGARRRDDPLHIATWQLDAAGTADPALLLRAAAHARHTHDYERAVTLFQAMSDCDRTIGTRVAVGDALFQMGKFSQAEAVLGEADASVTDEAKKVAVTLARTMNLAFGVAASDQALAVNDAALAQVHDPAYQRMLRINEGSLRISAGQPAHGLARMQDMDAEASQTQDTNAWLQGALMKPIGLAVLGRTMQAVSTAESNYAVHLQIDERTLVSHPAIQRIPLVFALSETGRLADARATAEQAFMEVTASCTSVRVWMAILAGHAEWLSGHLVTARRWYAEAATLARTNGWAMALQPALSGLAACAALLGDLEAAERALAEQPTSQFPPGFLPARTERLGQAWFYAARGHLAQARAVLAEAAEGARKDGHITSEALLLTDVARLGGAQDVAGRLTELAEQCDGTFAPARAHLAGALAKNEPEQLLAAADELERIGADLSAAETTSAAAAAWRAAGQARRATAATHKAQRLADRCQGARTPMLITAKGNLDLHVQTCPTDGLEVLGGDDRGTA